MNLLSRYITLLFFKNILILSACFISIYTLIDFFEKIDDFTEKDKPISLAIEFFLLNIPFILDQMGPVCILLAGVITLGVLNHSNELIALKSCGIPLRKIITPIIGGGLAATILLLTMSQFVLPKTIASTNKIWHQDVKGRVALGILRNDRFYYRGVDGFYSFIRPDLKKNDFRFFSYTSWSNDYKLNFNITAGQAVWKDNIWTLYNGQIQSRDSNSKQFGTEIFKEKNFNLPEQPTDFFVPEYRAMELSLTELYKETLKTRTAEEKNAALTDFYGRISYISLGIPLLLMGLPMLLFVYRAWGRDLSLAIPVSCGMAFGCWGAWGVLQSLAGAEYLNPISAAVSIHLIVGLTGIILLIREDC